MASSSASQSLRRTQAVLFDLDGTLLDSFQSHYRVYRHVFTDLGLPFDVQAYARYYSPNWYIFYGRMGLPKARWPEADRLWLHYYSREAPDRRQGADQALAAVLASGRALGLVTSGDRSRVERDLQRMGWTSQFLVVICGGDTADRKPKPAPLQAGLDQLQVPASRAAYVGDTVEDVTMGKAAGVLTVAVLGGFSSKETLEQTQPDVLVSSLRELTDLLVVTRDP